ncbi:MAG: adenine deaminase [Bacteroidota bacterium]
MKKITGNLVDLDAGDIYPAEIIYDHRILSIKRLSEAVNDYIIPGFVDAHIHIESSMLVPSEFARLATRHGTVATVSDPHEIANVLGVRGVEYMIDEGSKVNFKFYFGAPSCVPATQFETAGAHIGPDEIRQLLEREDVLYLAEMMNWPGVLSGDKEVFEKLSVAKKLGKPVDGHAPGLRGEDAVNYMEAGITTDHECYTYDEALHKMKHGMKILIREGSAAKNFEALIDLMARDPSQLMFCSDDKHPDDLVEGHINSLVRRSLERGYNLFDVLRVACVNPVHHYKLPVGLLRQGDHADFLIISSVKPNFKVLQTWVDGEMVSIDGKSLIARSSSHIINNFNAKPRQPQDFVLAIEGKHAKVIEVEEAQLITQSGWLDSNLLDEKSQTSIEQDVLKLTVVNRYIHEQPSFALVRNFGLERGAIASSVAHDSHNIIAVGTNNEDLCRAVNAVIQTQGGISAVDGEWHHQIALPVAGLMSIDDGDEVAKAYTEMNHFVKERLGGKLHAPFMTLSFLALLVIPELKLSDKGLFDAQTFQFTPVFEEPDID